MSKQAPAFHSFTYGEHVFSGPIHAFEIVEGVVQFTYSYVEDGISVTGSFTGERNGDTIKGAWKEHAKEPIEGRTSFEGAALLRVAETDGRRVCFGTWTAGPKISGRWTVDVLA